MNRSYFIKHDQRVRKALGCDRTTLLFDRLEFYSSRQPNGFYKFIEPNSHRLYKKDDSWTEVLNCHRTSFWRAFKLLGKKHKSQTEFDKADDKFEGKLYASYYDRLTNRMFFVRNHKIVATFFANIETKEKPAAKSVGNKKLSQIGLKLNMDACSVRTEQKARSYIEAENTSPDLSKDKSHAGDEIIKKMIDIWTAIVQEGRGQIELTGKLIAFLKKALTDKFNNCLQKWKEYCISIARSKFLMGEKMSWKADLEWSLKFESIRRVLSGNYYGIGDRNRELTPEELAEQERKREEQKKAKELEQERSLQVLEEEINNNSTEPDSVKNFRVKWLRSFGEKNYREILAECEMKLGEKETDLIIEPKERMTAIQIKKHWNPELLSDQPFKRVQIYHYIPDFKGKPLIFDHWLGNFEDVKAIEQGNGKNITSANSFDESTEERQSAETNQLRAHLKAHIPAKEYPLWLDGIRVQTIKPDGILVATFKDKLASDYAKLKLCEKILKSAVELWSEVSGLIIHEELDYLSVHDEGECLEIDERILVKQAMQSLIGDSFSEAEQGGGILNDWIPY